MTVTGLTDSMQLDYSDKKLLVADLDGAGLLALLGELALPTDNILLANDSDTARQAFENFEPDLVIVTVEPSQLRGMQLIQWLNQRDLPVAIIAATYNASAELSAAAIRSGATDVLDLNLEDTELHLERRVRRSLSLMTEQQVMGELGYPLFDETQQQFIGSSQAMQEVAKLIINAARSNASVFITGENGTGKEVCAELIHQHSKRNNSELVTLNCAAIPGSLAESELFGHVKGAFTSAVADRDGVAKRADNGTLFLDEIGEMDLDIQSKLLRFIQTGVFNPVGSNQYEKVDIRFICATNRDPNQQIAEGQFRQDLFYRLNVIQIHLPPLRQRGEDILILARRFLTQYASEENKRFTCLSPETEKLLLSYSWPGNIRELQNVIRNVVVLYNGEAVIPSMLPLAIIREKGERRKERLGSGQMQALEGQVNGDNTLPADGSRNPMLDRLRENVNELNSQARGMDSPGDIRPLDEVIEESIRHAIELCEGNIAEASHKLGVAPSTLYRRLKNR